VFQVELRRRVERESQYGGRGQAQQRQQDRLLHQFQLPAAQSQRMHAAERPEPQRQVTEDREQAQ